MFLHLDIDISFGIRKEEQHRCTWMVMLPGRLSVLFNPRNAKMNWEAMNPFSDSFIKKLGENPKEGLQVNYIQR